MWVFIYYSYLFVFVGVFFWGGGLLQFQIFLGVLDIPNNFYKGVNSRYWVLAYV